MVKVLTEKAQGPEFRFPSSHIKARQVWWLAANPVLGKAETGIPSATSQMEEGYILCKPSSINKVERTEEDT